MAKQLLSKPTAGFFYPWPIVLVSCVGSDGKPNIITIGASSVCSANPPTVGIAVNPSRYSWGLIQETGDFGVNLPTSAQVRETDLCGTASGRDTDKFAAANFTPVPSTRITSPLIAECPVSMECKVIQQVKLGSHDWIIGEVLAVHVDESILQADGGLDPEKTDPLISSFGVYWSLGERLERWSFTR